MAVRALGALLECADGFWQHSPTVLQQFNELIAYIVPRMGPHHLELLFKHVVTTGLFHADAVGGKSRVISDALAREICRQVLPPLLQTSFTLLDRYWTACLSNFHGTKAQGLNPLVHTVIATSTISLGKCVANFCCKVLV